MFEQVDDVVFDTCVLFPPTFRDLIVQLALNGCVNLRVPTIVLYELERVLSVKGHLDDVSARRATKKLADAFLKPTDVQPKSVGDDGVLDYCLANQIRILVTENVRDFPANTPLKVLDFASYLESLDPAGLGCIEMAVRNLTVRYKRPEITREQFLTRLQKLGVRSFPALLNRPLLTSEESIERLDSHPHF